MKKIVLLILIVTFISNFNLQAQWQSHNLDSIQITSLDASDSSIYVGSLGGVSISNNYGNNWIFRGLNPNFYTVLTVAKLGNKLFLGNNNNMKSSINDGASWDPIFTFVNYSVYSIIVKGSDLFSASWFGIHISTNNGVQWTSASVGLPELDPPTKLITNGSDLFTLADSVVYRSVNNAALWDSANTGLTNNPVFTLAAGNGALFAGTSSGVFISTNNGSLWSAANAGLPNSPVYSIAITGVNIYAATDSGVFVSYNNGMSWAAVNTGLPDTHVRFLAISGSKIFAALAFQTPTGELWSRPLSEVTGLSEFKEPSAFNLYPNPSQGRVTITDSFKEIQDITVLNLWGMPVYYVNATANNSYVNIDLSANPKGTYFVKIKSKKETATHKLIIQ